MNPPSWFTDLLRRSSEPGSSVELCRRFFEASEDERTAIRAAWDPKALWHCRDPLRILHPGETSSDAAERIRAQLLLQSFAIGALDPRDFIMSLASIHNLARLSGADADRLFLDVASVLDDTSRAAVTDFADRTDDLKGLRAFCLAEVADADGGRSLVLLPPPVYRSPARGSEVGGNARGGEGAAVNGHFVDEADELVELPAGEVADGEAAGG